MAIINCPECNKGISNKAESCPNCGFPINNKNNKIIVKQPQGCFMQTLNIGCLTVVIAFVLLAFSFFRTSSSPKINKLKNEAKNAIISKFKNPSK